VAYNETVKRDVPEPVKRALRQEVGFGCPVPYCREPFLSWHHFDPPWNQEEHHRPEGMIALCIKHHKMADNGVWSKAQLHDMKRKDYSAETVKGKFEWARPGHLVRVGGVYVTPDHAELLQSDIFNCNPVFAFNENPAGLLELSLWLRSPANQVLASINTNTLEAHPPKLYDMNINASATKVKIWIDRNKQVLDLWCKRISLDELTRVIQNDISEWAKFRDKMIKANPNLSRHVELIASTDDNPGPYLMPTTAGVPTEKGSIFVAKNPLDDSLSNDLTIEMIRSVAKHKCTDDEGRVMLMDINQLSTYVNGTPVTIKRGIALSPQSVLGFGASLNSEGVPYGS
jgi:hypothetical protein